MENRKSCGFCDAWSEIPGHPDVGVCRAKSPTPYVVGMQQGSVKGLGGQRTASPVVATVFPEMPRSGWCRDYIMDMSKVPLTTPTLKPFSFELGEQKIGDPIIP
jgi:hypothetical protein